MITQEEFKTVENKIEKINTIVGAILGTECDLKTTYNDENEFNKFIEFKSRYNYLLECGIFKKLFKSVKLEGSADTNTKDDIIIHIWFKNELKDSCTTTTPITTIAILNDGFDTIEIWK